MKVEHRRLQLWATPELFRSVPTNSPICSTLLCHISTKFAFGSTFVEQLKSDSINHQFYNVKWSCAGAKSRIPHLKPYWFLIFLMPDDTFAMSGGPVHHVGSAHRLHPDQGNHLSNGLRLPPRNRSNKFISASLSLPIISSFNNVCLYNNEIVS